MVEKHTEAMVFMKDFVHKFPEQRVGCVTCGMVDPIVRGFTGDIYFNGKCRLIQSDVVCCALEG